MLAMYHSRELNRQEQRKPSYEDEDDLPKVLMTDENNDYIRKCKTYHDISVLGESQSPSKMPPEGEQAAISERSNEDEASGYVRVDSVVACINYTNESPRVNKSQRDIITVATDVRKDQPNITKGRNREKSGTQPRNRKSSHFKNSVMGLKDEQNQLRMPTMADANVMKKIGFSILGNNFVYEAEESKSSHLSHSEISNQRYAILDSHNRR